MKVWEYIKNSFNDTKEMTRESLKAEIYMHKYTPCEMEDNHEVLNKNESEFMNLMNCDLDCEKCLDKYLDMEIEEG